MESVGNLLMCKRLTTRSTYLKVGIILGLCVSQVKKAFFALVANGVRAAPLWDTDKQCFVGKKKCVMYCI